MDKHNDIKELMNWFIRYRGTNCSQLAKKLGMTRQALFRMVDSETIKMTTFLKIIDELSIDVRFLDKDGKKIPSPYNGPAFKKRIKGVLYDSNKLFTLREQEDCGIKVIYCLEPKSGSKLKVAYNSNANSGEEEIAVKLI